MTNVLGSYTVPASAVFAGGLDVDNVGASATITPVWCAGPYSSRLLGRPPLAGQNILMPRACCYRPRVSLTDLPPTLCCMRAGRMATSWRQRAFPN